MEEAIRKADVLIEALPYIKQFHKKVAVIKYGGSILGEERIRRNVLEDIVFLSFTGMRVILVHGGGPNISQRMRTKGKKTEFLEGMRVTDEETLGLVEEELDKLNALLVEEITNLGAKAAGLSGKHNQLIQVKKKKAKIDLGLVGEIEEFMFEQLLLQSSVAEAHAAYGGFVVGYNELQVVTACPDSSGGSVEADSLCGEDRPGIALAEGLELFHFVDCFSFECAQRRHRIDIELVDDVFFAQNPGGVGFKVLCKLGDFFGVDGKAGGHLVPAEVNQML